MLLSAHIKIFSFQSLSYRDLFLINFVPSWLSGYRTLDPTGVLSKISRDVNLQFNGFKGLNPFTRFMSRILNLCTPITNLRCWPMNHLDVKNPAYGRHWISRRVHQYQNKVKQTKRRKKWKEKEEQEQKIESAQRANSVKITQGNTLVPE